MKKNLFILLFVAMLGIAFVSPAFAEEFVPPAPGVTASEMKEAIGGVSKDIKRSSAKNTQRLEKALGENRKAIVSLANNTKDLAVETGKVATTTGQNTDAIKAVRGKVDTFIKSLGTQSEQNAWLIGSLIIGALLLTALLLWFFYRCGRSCNTTNTKTILTAISNVGNRIVAEVPPATARLRQELNPEPFEIDTTGHHVTYVSPPEGIAQGYYRTLKIEEMPDGPDHPETFERQMVNNRGSALHYLTGTFKKFLEGKLKGTPQESLILYLWKSTGEIKIRKTT